MRGSRRRLTAFCDLALVSNQIWPSTRPYHMATACGIPVGPTVTMFMVRCWARYVAISSSLIAIWLRWLVPTRPPSVGCPMADVESATVAEPRDPLQTRRVTASAPDRRALAARLAGIGCVAADEEADALLARSHAPAWLDAAIARRSDGEPLAWICGTHRFCGLDLRIDPGVYVPRIESEELARRAAA